MKVKYLFYLQGLFAILSALGLIFAPVGMWALWGLPSRSPEMELAGRDAGVLTVFVGLVAVFAARAEDSPLRRDLCLAYFLGYVVATVVFVLPLLTGGPTLGPAWIVSLILALAFGYFRFVKPGA